MRRSLFITALFICSFSVTAQTKSARVFIINMNQFAQDYRIDDFHNVFFSAINIEKQGVSHILTTTPINDQQVCYLYTRDHLSSGKLADWESVGKGGDHPEAREFDIYPDHLYCLLDYKHKTKLTDLKAGEGNGAKVCLFNSTTEKIAALELRADTTAPGCASVKNIGQNQMTNFVNVTPGTYGIYFCPLNDSSGVQVNSVKENGVTKKFQFAAGRYYVVNPRGVDDITE